tara:strand:- start:7085 stop:7387 length:303 start_codon:yes stop_codon:yes gene_type:complete
MSDIKKIIDDGYHICVNLNMFLEISKYSNFGKISMDDILLRNYYGYFEPNKNMLFIDRKIKDNHIKIFLGSTKPFIDSVDWSEEIHVDKVFNFLKLKAFI